MVDWVEIGAPATAPPWFLGGERIYHVLRQEYYDETHIQPQHGERWFCSEAEARGWMEAGEAVNVEKRSGDDQGSPAVFTLHTGTDSINNRNEHGHVSTHIAKALQITPMFISARFEGAAPRTSVVPEFAQT